MAQIPSGLAMRLGRMLLLRESSSWPLWLPTFSGRGVPSTCPFGAVSQKLMCSFGVKPVIWMRKIVPTLPQAGVTVASLLAGASQPDATGVLVAAGAGVAV